MPCHHRLVVPALLALLAAGPQARAEAEQSVVVLRLAQATEPARLVPALLSLPSGRAEGVAVPAVVLVTDAYALDSRVADLSATLLEEGWATVQIDLDAASLEGPLAAGAEPAAGPDDDWIGAQLLSDVLAHLAERREIDARRVAAVGLGSGGRVALLAGSEETAFPILGPYGPRFAAHAAFYPGCSALRESGYAAPQPWSTAPNALFVAGRDTREPPGSCQVLREELAVAGRPALRWHDYPTASYAWDIGTVYGTRPVLLPVQGGQRIRTEADPAVTLDAAERLVSFLRPVLGRPGSR